MRRCLAQRFSQYAFQCLEAESQQQQHQQHASMNQQRFSTVQQELEYLGDVLHWLPDFWLRLIGLKKSIKDSSDSFPLSPLRLLICPLTLHSSWIWFKELWEAEVQTFLNVRASSLPPTHASVTPQQRWADVTRWMFASWPWPELPSCFNGLPQLHRRDGTGFLSQMSLTTTSLSTLSILGPRDHLMCSSDLGGISSSIEEHSRPESSTTLYE